MQRIRAAARLARVGTQQVPAGHGPHGESDMHGEPRPTRTYMTTFPAMERRAVD